MGISAGGTAVAALPILTLLLLPHPAAPFSFTYNFTSPSDTPPPGIAFQGDAFYNKAIRLTRDERLGPITSSTGRAFYSRAVPLADPISRRPASFVTAFAFSIAAPDPASASGDGLAFFLSPFPSVLPESSAGGLLGLFNSSSVRAGTLVAVEFDTYKNEWDPSGDHVGVDLGGIVSAATADWPTSMKDGRTAHARVEYDGGAKNLTVALSYGSARPNATDDVLLWYAVDLRDHLPDSVAVGFSAATGEAAELHQVLYWEFTSTFDPKEETVVLWVVLGLCALLLVLVCAGIVWFVRQWRKAGQFDDGDIEPSKARLVPWVWELYGKNAFLEAADWRLKGQFDEKQMERLMIVGLWCAHPDYAHRPSIRQALNVLKFEAPLPALPPKMPVPTYFPLPDLVASISVAGTSIATEDPVVSDYGSSGKASSVRDRLLEP
ncbi:unnamed protein product [Miscanthus lutarioriparius]|uniref:Legume lectin domain-containing protein n=1 Tax=Miscanthus lutarioriparius TaxID=422564 RepID=A0A811P966_9POAL|nr:unnamed protein product [Miscanthus lutarioriparius]